MRSSAAQGMEVLVMCVVLALSGLALTGCARPNSVEARLPDTATSTPTGSARTVPLAALIQSWPSTWTVTGTHSEATYVEHVTISRRNDEFTLRIVITAQGSQGGGTWDRSVRITAAGHIQELDADGCGGSCAGLDGTRGYLAAAALLSLRRSGTVPASGTELDFGARQVICVNGDQLYAATGMATEDDSLRLDPCFDRVTGAVVAQYSPVLGHFGGPTLDTDTLRISVPATTTP